MIYYDGMTFQLHFFQLSAIALNPNELKKETITF